MNVKMVFPLGADEFAMELKQTDDGRQKVVKVITGHSEDEVKRLLSIGWKVQE